mmetsp:Transcript_108951/g.347871  ORF Transcript_108951/g.347871 Transcript_108951/m.347871 type:complete len:205 (-) Transcript_108951:377-991(-)
MLPPALPAPRAPGLIHLLDSVVARAAAAGIDEGEPRVRPGQAAVHHENLGVHHVRQGQPTEGLREGVEEPLALRPVAVIEFLREAVEEVQLYSLMVPSVQSDRLREAQLQCKQRENDLQGVRASVHKVAIEEIRVVISGHTCELEDPQEVVVLPMKIADHHDLVEVDPAKCVLVAQDGRRILNQAQGIRKAHDHLAGTYALNRE